MLWSLRNDVGFYEKNLAKNFSSIDNYILESLVQNYVYKVATKTTKTNEKSLEISLKLYRFVYHGI